MTRRLVNTLSGQGALWLGEDMIAEVTYELRVYQNTHAGHSLAGTSTVHGAPEAQGTLIVQSGLHNIDPAVSYRLVAADGTPYTVHLAGRFDPLRGILSIAVSNFAE